VLEVEVDEAGRRPRLVIAAAEQEQRGLDRKRGDAGAADRRNMGVDFRFDPLGTLRRQRRG
jgi:hypothetical protein